MGKNLKHIIFSIYVLLLLFVNNSKSYNELKSNSTIQRNFTLKTTPPQYFLYATTFHYSHTDAIDLDTSSPDDNEDEDKDVSEIAFLAQHSQRFAFWHLNTSINNNFYQNHYQGIIIALTTPPPQV